MLLQQDTFHARPGSSWPPSLPPPWIRVKAHLKCRAFLVTSLYLTHNLHKDFFAPGILITRVQHPKQSNSGGSHDDWDVLWSKHNPSCCVGWYLLNLLCHIAAWWLAWQVWSKPPKSRLAFSCPATCLRQENLHLEQVSQFSYKQLFIQVARTTFNYAAAPGAAAGSSLAQPCASQSVALAWTVAVASRNEET